MQPDQNPIPPQSDYARVAAPVYRTPTQTNEEIRRSRKLFSLGFGAAAAGIFYYTYNAKVDDPLHLYLGQIIIILSILPGMLWARRAKFGLPVFETFMLTGLNTYAIPLLGGHQALSRFEARTVTMAALGVVIFQVSALLVFLLVRTRPKRTPFWTKEIVTNDISRYLGYGMIVTSIYTVVIAFTDWIPADLTGIVRAVAYGVGIIATFIQCRRWGAGELRQHEKISFTILLVIQVIFSWVTLFLVGGISIMILGLLGFVSGGKRIPIITLAVVLPIIGVLHNGKSTMRDKYWDGGREMPLFADIPAFFVEWIGYGLDPEIQSKRTDNNRLLERTSLFHLMCLVVSITPEKQPYLNGETYAQVPGQFVPRFFWPEKPVGHISTYTLAIYFGLQRAEDTAKTTIGFGLLTEAYANFGFFGLALLGAFFGTSFKLVSVWASQSPILAFGGMFMVVLMSWSFQTELTMSIWLSSLFQGCVAVLGIPYVLRNLLR